MMIKTSEHYFQINRTISEVWEVIGNVVSRYDGKVTSIDKIDNYTWHFSFSFTRSLLSRFSLTLISGEAIGKEGNETLVKIKSSIDILAIFMVAAVLISVFIIEVVKISFITYLLKFSIMGAILLFFVYAYNKEVEVNINELVHKLNIE